MATNIQDRLQVQNRIKSVGTFVDNVMHKGVMEALHSQVDEFAKNNRNLIGINSR
jgi:hypothetical protein